ncbi:MAG: hypothetical protein OEQ53_20185 [Saprospiraceae bacterium]|nr:hypothetical protein [Saprospiraceae bacterium]
MGKLGTYRDAVLSFSDTLEEPVIVNLVMKLTLILSLFIAVPLWSQQKSDLGIRHAIVISGPKTFEINEQDEVVWEYKGNSKDMFKLSNGNYLITYPEEVIEVTPSKEVIWSYQSAINPEFMSAQRLPDGNTLVTEQGEHPRLVEVDRHGTIIAEIPVQPESDNVHMQSRMARKLPNGNYLVPHRIMPFTKEYDSNGRVVRTFRVDIPELGGPEAENGTFAAIRLKNGSTLITCASGNRMVLFDKKGEVEWHLTTAEVGGQLQDVCGLQVLKNGNFLVSCYGNQTADGLKMIEITRDKKIVWTYQNPDAKFVHNVQVLSTNGEPE